MVEGSLSALAIGPAPPPTGATAVPTLPPMASASAFNVMKNAYRLQELVIKITASRHPAVEHSLEKVSGLKRAFHFVNHEGVEGDYVEFGMFEGASFIGALHCHLATAGDPKPQRTFHGFD